MTTNKDQISKGDAMRLVSAALTGVTPFADYVERVLALWPTKAKKPTNTIRSELAYGTARYGIVYFDDARQTVMPLAVGMKGIRFRHPVTTREVENGMLLLDYGFIALLSSLRYGHTRLEQFQFVDETKAPLPTNLKTLTYKEEAPVGRQQVEVSGFVLAEWFQRQQIVAGDAILLTVDDWTALRFILVHEPAAARQPRLIAARNRALADLLYQMLEQDTDERLPASDAVPAALMRLPDPQGYPGDPWLTVITADQRMFSYGDEIRYATTEDHIFDALWSGQAEKEVADPLRAPLTDEQAQRIYRFKCELTRRKGLWRVIDIRGDATLADFNRMLVSAFNHDFDHMGGFWKLVRRGNSKRFREVDLGSVDPLGKGEAADVQIANIGLEAGDRIKYVFDFGDWIEHTLTLDAIFAPSELDTAADLPRVVTQNRIRHHYCTSCAEEGKKSVATYLCIECSNREQRPVYLCEACVDDTHEDHYIQEILY